MVTLKLDLYAQYSLITRQNTQNTTSMLYNFDRQFYYRGFVTIRLKLINRVVVAHMQCNLIWGGSISLVFRARRSSFITQESSLNSFTKIRWGSLETHSLVIRHNVSGYGKWTLLIGLTMFHWSCVNHFTTSVLDNWWVIDRRLKSLKF